MKEIKYNKLVRDKIPNIISEAGKQARVYKEHGDKLLAFLDKKLQEELDEYVNSREIEELIMEKQIVETGKINRGTEELFIELFCDVFGPEKSNYLFVQYPFMDIYGRHRLIDFALESDGEKIAIEVDGEAYHNPNKISNNKYYDDLLKQNSLVYQDWKVYRWVYSQLKYQPEKIKDEMLTFLGELPNFKAIDDYLPSQKGKSIELKGHQQEAIGNLKAMRSKGESIALLYHATGERVIIVTGCINVLVSRVSETFIKNNSCIA